jgi:lipopolysaccharide/colanic/teichoic acid biosynthesis glycosyltransferase
MKRIFDITLSAILLSIFGIPLIVASIVIWLQDYKSPLYLAPRVSMGGGIFTMIKLRSMTVNADASKIDSTAADDMRITRVGKLIRKFKLDELSQLINVLNGSMSFVGPRPQVQRDVNLYTKEEKKILTGKPGITDFSSIVFSDEGEILQGFQDPDLAYNQIIRPWKSRLAIFYLDNRTMLLDIKLIMLTVYSFINKKKTLKIISNILENLQADPKIVSIVLRENDLVPTPPPGSSTIVKERKI